MRWLLVSALLLLRAASVIAQSEGPWSTLPIAGQFDPWYDTLAASGPLFFSDELHGYVSWRGPGALLSCETADGGMSWQVLRRFVPIPHVLKGRIGFSPSGYLTTDSGKNWRHAMDSQMVQLVGSPFIGSGESRYLVGLRWLADGYVKQMLMSSDFGRTWVNVDSVTTFTCSSPGGDSVTKIGLQAGTRFGVSPVDSTGHFTWVRLGGFVDSLLYAVSTNGLFACSWPRRERFYMWRINVATGVAVHWEIPPFLAQHIDGWTVLGRSAMLCWANGTSTVLYRSSDEGRSWDSIVNFNPGKLHFVSERHAITDTRYSIDSGRSWKPWHSAYGSFGQFFALDSLHLFGAGTDYGLRQFVRSSDGGRTWVANRAAPAKITGAFADDDILIVSASPRYLLVSVDSGRTWSNRALASGALPSGLTGIGPIALVDSSFGRRRLMAGATYVVRDSVRFGLVESLDNGISWTNMPIALEEPVDYLTVIRESSPAILMRSGWWIYGSIDGGATWRHSGVQGNSLAMGSLTRGIAAVRGTSASDGALMRTDDGGATWRDTLILQRPNSVPYGLVAFDSMRYAAILPNLFQRAGSQYVAHTSNAGATWRLLAPRSTLGGIVDPFFWLSPSVAYCASAGEIKYSSDSGRTFVLLNEEWGSTASVRDDHHIYLINLDRQLIGRWRLRDESAAVIAGDVPPASRIRLITNPVVDDILTVEIAGASPRGGVIVLASITGEVLRRIQVAGSVETKRIVGVDVSDLRVAPYFVTWIGERSGGMRAFTILR